jgi:hypothetical protein
MLMVVLISIVVICAAAGPPIYRKMIETSEEADKRKFLSRMERYGTLEQKERAKQIREREENIKLKLLECTQAAAILDSPEVRDKLEHSNIDVEELKRLLSDSSNDEVLKEFKQLEARTLQGDSNES